MSQQEGDHISQGEQADHITTRGNCQIEPGLVDLQCGKHLPRVETVDDQLSPADPHHEKRERENQRMCHHPRDPPRGGSRGW